MSTQPQQPMPRPPDGGDGPGQSTIQLAWGAKVTPEFRAKVVAISRRLEIDPSQLMACMAFESAETFRPDIRNAAGSGAVGLIQFMPQTAALLGTSTEALADKSPVDQLDDVERYFLPHAGRLHNEADLYMAILWPKAIGQPGEFVIFDQADPNHPKLYIENRGLDFNHDGKITKDEAARPIADKLAKGLSVEFVYQMAV